MSKTKRFTAGLVCAIIMAVSLVFSVFFAVQVRAAAEAWTAMNGNTSVASGKISAGDTAGSNRYVAEYNETIDLADGFKVDFTVDALAGEASEPNATASNGIAFALTGTAASETPQNAYVFVYGKDGPSVRLYTYYTTDFAISADGAVSFTDTGLFDATTGALPYDTEATWEENMPMSLAGDIVNGFPTFWLNGSAVNPFGSAVNAALAANGSTPTGVNAATAFRNKLYELYAQFIVVDDAMHLYAFSTAEEAQAGEFSITVSDVTVPYQAAQGGWFATDVVSSRMIGTDVVFSDIKPLIPGAGVSISRTRFIYDKIFDLDDENIEFEYSTLVSCKPDWVTLFSVRGVGMNQFTSAKTVDKAAYEDFYFYGGATIGAFDNGSWHDAQAFGTKSGGAIGVGSATVGDEWATWRVFFGSNGNGGFDFRINGTTVASYSRDEMVAFLGDDLKAELVMLPNSEVVAAKGSYKLTNFAQSLTADITSQSFTYGTDATVSFSVELPNDSVTLSQVALIGEDENTVLEAGTDYTIDGGNVTFTNAYLRTLGLGESVFMVTASNGFSINLTVSVSAGVTVNTDGAKLSGPVKDMHEITVGIEMTYPDDTIVSVSVGDVNVPLGSDPSKVTLPADVLNALHAGTHTVRIVTEYGGGSFEVVVEPVATQAPEWTDEQSSTIELDSANVGDLVLHVDLKDAVDCYVTVNGVEVEGVTYDKDAKTVTVPAAAVKTFPVRDSEIVVNTDGGATSAYTVRWHSYVLQGWEVTSSDVVAPVLNDKNEISVTGQTTLLYQEKVDLSKGYSFRFRFDAVYDWYAITGTFIEFNVEISQGSSRILLYIRTQADGSMEHRFAAAQLIQQFWNADGAMVTNEQMTRTVPLDQDQKFSIQLLDSTFLTMFNETESRLGGLNVSAMQEQRFDNATVTVNFNTGNSIAHKNDSAGTFSIGAFDEDELSIPAWAKPYFLDPVATPVLRVEGNTIVWDAITGALQYTIYLNGEPQAIATENYYDFSVLGEVGDTFTIQVKANGDGMIGSDSALSDAIEVTIQGEEKGGCSGTLFHTGFLGISSIVLAGVAVAMVLVRKKED